MLWKNIAVGAKCVSTRKRKVVIIASGIIFMIVAWMVTGKLQTARDVLVVSFGDMFGFSESAEGFVTEINISQKNDGEPRGFPPEASGEISPKPATAVGVLGVQSSEEANILECNIGETEQFRSPVLISEIAWMGTDGSPNYEWIEIGNRSEYRVDIGSWSITDDRGKIKALIPSGSAIEPGEHLILERGSDDTVPNVEALAIYSGTLPNRGADLALFNNSCELADLVEASDGWPAGDNSLKLTMERSEDLEWHNSQDPLGTPGSMNSLAKVDEGLYSETGVKISSTLDLRAEPQEHYSEPASSSESNLPADTKDDIPVDEPLETEQDPEPGTIPEPDLSDTETPEVNILISEILYDALGGDSGKEFVELYNHGDEEADIAGWKLMKDGKGLATIGSKKEDNVIIPARGYFLIGLAGYSGDISADVVRSASLPNTKASISLVDAGGKMKDEILYAESAEPGQSLERVSWEAREFRPMEPSPRNSGN